MAYYDDLFIISQTVEESVKNPPNLVDPTSQLPDHILHLIFSYLSFDDLLHVRLVSKSWHRSTPSHIEFHLTESFFRNRNPNSYSYKRFWDSICRYINLSKNKLINAEKRVLHAKFIDEVYICDIMKLLDGNNFHEVSLRVSSHYLPYAFQSKCLAILHLTNCYFDEHVLRDELMIPSLQELKLEDVMLSEEILPRFSSACPNIRELSLVACRGITCIVLTKLAHLKKLYVNVTDFWFFTNIQVIAPRLQVFHFILRNREIKDHITMDIRACKMLQEFHLNCSKFPNGLDPENFCLDFPHLETLLLGPCETKKPIKISGPSLKKWILSIPYVYECSRKNVVSSPNLSSFQYRGTTFQPYLAPPRETSKLLEINYNTIVLIPKILQIMKRSWFIRLRSHLENFINHNTTLVMRICEEAFSYDIPSSKPSGRAPTQPLHYIKHLRVDMKELKYPEEHLMRVIIDNLLWMSHPHTLTLSIPTSFSPTALGVIKKLYGRKNRNCCSGTPDKCWCHFLKYFEVKEEEEEKGHLNALSAHTRKVKKDSDGKMNKLTNLIFKFFWKFNS